MTFGSGLLIGYVLAFTNAIELHTLHSKDRVLLSPTTLLVVALMAAGGVWGWYDLFREYAVLKEERRKNRVPYEVSDERYWREKLAAAIESGDRHAQGVALGYVGRSLADQDRVTEAEPLLTQALEIAQSLGDHRQEWRIYNTQSRCAFERGNLAEAETLSRASMAAALAMTPDSFATSRYPMIPFLDEKATACEFTGTYLIEYCDKRDEGIQMLEQALAFHQELARYYATEMQWSRSRRRKNAERAQKETQWWERQISNVRQGYPIEKEE